MEFSPCKICNETGHQVSKCPELCASLYGKLGEGGQRGHSHEEEEEAKVVVPVGNVLCLHNAKQHVINL